MHTHAKHTRHTVHTRRAHVSHWTVVALDLLTWPSTSSNLASTARCVIGAPTVLYVTCSGTKSSNLGQRETWQQECCVAVDQQRTIHPPPAPQLGPGPSSGQSTVGVVGEGDWPWRHCVNRGGCCRWCVCPMMAKSPPNLYLQT